MRETRVGCGVRDCRTLWRGMRRTVGQHERSHAFVRAGLGFEQPHRNGSSVRVADDQEACHLRVSQEFGP